jgi:hypothetical protein
MSEESQDEWVVGLYGYQDRPPESCAFERFYLEMIRLLGELGLALSHIAAEGESYSGKLVKPSSATGKRILESKFAGITVLAMYVAPVRSKEPSYERIFATSLSWNRPNEILLCVVANECVTPFLSKTFDQILRGSLTLLPWAYGLAFRDAVTRQPDFHVLALDSGRLSRVESQALAKWYSSPTAERQRKLRSIYPVNILGPNHLKRALGAQTLGEYVRNSQDTTVEEAGSLLIWKIPERRVESIRVELANMNALIT